MVVEGQIRVAISKVISCNSCLDEEAFDDDDLATIELCGVVVACNKRCLAWRKFVWTTRQGCQNGCGRLYTSVALHEEDGLMVGLCHSGTGKTLRQVIVILVVIGLLTHNV